MIKKIISISLLLLLTFSFCFAIEVEQKLPGLSKDPSLAEYMGYIIDLIFKIGVFLAVLAFVIGAIKYATSMGSAEAMKEGKTRMISALLGVVLLLSSLMILKEINPEIEPKGLKPLETGSGAYFSNSINDVPAAPNGTIENITKSGYSKIKNICQDEKVDRPLVLKTWSSPKTALTWMNQTVQEIKCGGNVPIPQNQYEYELSTKDPGIYLISGGCDGPRSSRILVNTPALPEGYRNNLNGVIIINDVAPAGTDQSTNAYYGALFFQLNNYLGKCSTIYLAGENTDRINGKCSGMVADSFFNSFYFFEYNPTPATSGDGVVFYTEAFGGTKAKEAAASYSYLPKYRYAIWDSAALNKTKYAKRTPSLNPCEGKSLLECLPKSIEIKGNYMLILRAKNGICDVLFQGSALAINLNDSKALNKDNLGLDSMEIIVLKPQWH